MSSRVALSAGLLASALIAEVSHAQDQPLNPILASLGAAWKQRQDQAPAIKYHMTGKWVIYPVDTTGPGVPPGKTPKTIRIERKLIIDWPTGRYRNETNEKTDASYESKLQVYNGEVIKGKRQRLRPDGTPEPSQNEKMGIGKGSLKHALFTSDYWPIFYSNGMLPATMKDGFYPGHLKYPVALDMFHVHGTERVDGRVCTVLRTYPSGTDKAFYEYVVDRQRDGAVMRATRFIGEQQRYFNLTISYQKSAAGWQPTSWRHEAFDGRSLIQFHEFDAVQIDLPKVADSDFDIIPDENQLVVSNTYVPEHGGKVADSQLYQQRDGALVPVEMKDGQIVRRWTWRGYLLLGFVVVLGTVLVWRTSRRWNRSGKPPVG
jgi:hypothetical protein